MGKTLTVSPGYISTVWGTLINLLPTRRMSCGEGAMSGSSALPFPPHVKLEGSRKHLSRKRKERSQPGFSQVEGEILNDLSHIVRREVRYNIFHEMDFASMRWIFPQSKGQVSTCKIFSNTLTSISCEPKTVSASL